MTAKLLETAAMHAVVIVAAVEAIRSRTSGIRGPWVLALAGGIAVALTALFMEAYSLYSLLQAMRVAALSWLIAVGGNGFLVKLATKSRPLTIVSESERGRR